jgi:hypothetical protein
VFCRQWSATTTSYKNSSLELGLDLEKLEIVATIVNLKSLRLIICSLNFIGPICHIKTLKHIHIVVTFMFWYVIKLIFSGCNYIVDCSYFSKQTYNDKLHFTSLIMIKSLYLFSSFSHTNLMFLLFIVQVWNAYLFCLRTCLCYITFIYMSNFNL